MKLHAPPVHPEPLPALASRKTQMQQAAVELEATFLAEFLKSTGLGKSRSAFGGGAGEDQFTSFLVRQQAEQLARAGGIGLAEMLFHSMMEADQNAGSGH